ncbi:ABC transporter permease [Bdellovibrionota bacterium FG-2]
MFAYLLKRLLGLLPTLALLLTLVFFVLRLAPGGPFDTERAFPPEIQAAIAKRYHLDQPVVTQFAMWTRDLVSGDLGESFQYLGQSVSELILASLPYTLILGVLALILSILFGVPLGAVAAWKQNSAFDQLAMFVSNAGVSLPSFLVAGVLVFVFSYHLEWLPPALWDGPSSLILPVLTLGIRPVSLIARLTRASMIEVLSEDYIRTARGKGLSSRTILFKHALKNSFIPVITVLGPIAANLVTGSFLVEIVFQLPGMGKHFVQAVLNRDYPLVMGVTLVYGVVLLLCNLLVDLAYTWIDPRIRL